MSRVVIVGGGITGLAAAWELQQQGVDYTLLESTARLGGKITTERVEGFVIEGAADSFLWQKTWAWQLARELGLEDRIIGTNENQRSVYVLHNGKLELYPRGMRLIVPIDPDGLMQSGLLSESGKQRMLAEETLPPRSETGDESLGAFLRRRFGEEALAMFGDSILSGIHVADPERLSMQAVYPNYLQLEQEYGSVTGGMKHQPNPEPYLGNTPTTAFISFKTGVYELIEALSAKLTGNIRCDAPISHIEVDGRVISASGEHIQADAVILTTPSAVAGHLLSDSVPPLAEMLAATRTLSSGTVTFGFRADEIEHPLDGYGFVVPSQESSRLLASTWSSTKLAGRAPEGHVLLRVFFGGYAHQSDVDLPDDQLIALARAELKAIMGIHATPVISRIYRWRNANPQFDVGHLERVAKMHELSPRWLHLAGSPYEGIGIPDCVHQGREAAKRAISVL